MLVRQVSTRLAVLPAGRPSADPMAGLTSERMKRLLDEARQSFDWVILDTPPVMLLPDAHLMASMVDGAVLVVRAGSTPHELVRRAAEAIGRSRILGVVLNRAELTGPARSLSVLRLRLQSARKRQQGLMRFLLHRVRLRSIALAACETAFIMAAVAIAAVLRLGLGGHVRAVPERRRHHQDAAGRRDRPGQHVLRRPVRPAHRGRPPRAVHAPDSGAGHDVVRTGRHLFLVPLDHARPRRVPHRRDPRDDDGGALACGLRMAERPAGSARAAPARRARARPPWIWRASWCRRRHELGVEIVGFIDPDPAQDRHGPREPRHHRRDRGHPGDRASGGRSIASWSAWRMRAARFRSSGCST